MGPGWSSLRGKSSEREPHPLGTPRCHTNTRCEEKAHLANT